MRNGEAGGMVYFRVYRRVVGDFFLGDDAEREKVKEIGKTKIPLQI